MKTLAFILGIGSGALLVSYQPGIALSVGAWVGNYTDEPVLLAVGISILIVLVLLNSSLLSLRNETRSRMDDLWSIFASNQEMILANQTRLESQPQTGLECGQTENKQ